MREYKFRGKRKDNGEWVYGYYFIEERDIEDGIIWRDIPQIQQRYGDHFQYFDVDLATVGQYTGLHDKNGKEIYEGDIIKAKTFNYPLCIEWDRGECAFVMRSTHSGATYGFMWEIEIIGNIYDNPELMKEGSGLSPEEVQELAQAKADGRLKILPAKPGDIIYRPEALQFCWVITKVEIYEDEIVFIDDSDNIFRPDDIGKTVFLTKEAAEKAIGGKEDDK